MVVMLDAGVIVHLRMPVAVLVRFVVHVEMRGAAEIETYGDERVKGQHQEQQPGDRGASARPHDSKCTPRGRAGCARSSSARRDSRSTRRIVVVGGSALIVVIASLWLVERSLDVKLAAAPAAVHSSPFGLCRSHHDRETELA